VRYSSRITSVISPTCAIATGYDPWKSAKHAPSTGADSQTFTRYSSYSLLKACIAFAGYLNKSVCRRDRAGCYQTTVPQP